MRLGAPIPGDQYSDPASWVLAVQALGYRAAYCPVGLDADTATIRAYADAAVAADIVIAEVGAWSNPLSRDESERAAALAKCKQALAVADQIGACCCVNIAGSRGEKWDGPHPADLTEATFDLIVATVRAIIDAVQPTRTFYTLEPMPWMYPDSVTSYLRLIEAVDRPAFGAHLDPVNVINSPALYFRNADLLRDWYAQLGPHIKAIHAKDIILHGTLTVHLDEVRPGLGTLDYGVFLRETEALNPDLPFMLEHLPQAEYTPAAEYVRSVAQREGIAV